MEPTSASVARPIMEAFRRLVPTLPFSAKKKETLLLYTEEALQDLSDEFPTRSELANLFLRDFRLGLGSDQLATFVHTNFSPRHQRFRGPQANPRIAHSHSNLALRRHCLPHPVPDDPPLKPDYLDHCWFDETRPITEDSFTFNPIAPHQQQLSSDDASRPAVAPLRRPAPLGGTPRFSPPALAGGTPRFSPTALDRQDSYVLGEATADHLMIATEMFHVARDFEALLRAFEQREKKRGAPSAIIPNTPRASPGPPHSPPTLRHTMPPRLAHGLARPFALDRRVALLFVAVPANTTPEEDKEDQESFARLARSFGLEAYRQAGRFRLYHIPCPDDVDEWPLSPRPASLEMMMMTG
ncbi:hypothetical protein PAPYR_8911 [Paratrimastix pyriformis]|uniref:Uncharacterized protein n=1 Tax=Paratrimastix pyriformis TaxID=342808 RepID=A0ABQ8UF47_9EUKA|nr:hypothetical protein PAPYR_8911 [Paratrimastix pyriformis]